MTDRAAVKDGVLQALREFRGKEQSDLASLAATIAAGIEANPDLTRQPADTVAKRAVDVARAILAEVSK